MLQSAAMTAIVTALRAGLERETLQRMLDAADNALRLTDEQRRQADGPAPVQPAGGEAPAQLAGPSNTEAGISRGQSGASSAADEADGGQARRTQDRESAGEDSAAPEARLNGGLGRISLRIKLKQGGDASSSGVRSYVSSGRPLIQSFITVSRTTSMKVL